MKKSILLIAAMAVCLTAGAQLKSNLRPFDPSVMTTETTMATAVEQEAKTAKNHFVKKAPKIKATTIADWRRPAGAFYGVHTTDMGSNSLSTLYAPYIMLKPFYEYTFVNTSTGETSGTTYEWNYQKYNQETKAKMWYQSSDKDLTTHWISENDTTPELTAFSNGTSTSAKLLGWKYDKDQAKFTTESRSTLLARGSYQTAYSNTDSKELWMSPKYFAANCNRDASKTAGSYYGTMSNTFPDGTKGNWYGRNPREYNGMGMAFEKPTHPYVLRQVGLRYQGLEFRRNEPVTFTAKVYRLPEMQQYNDTASVKLYPSELELVCQSEVTLDSIDVPKRQSGIMKFSFVAEEDGLTYELTPEIDFPILVCIEDYNNDALGYGFTALYSSDTYDEGFGEQCYLAQPDPNTGELYYSGQNNFFTSGELHRGLSILADIEYPYMIWDDLDMDQCTIKRDILLANEGESQEFPIYSLRSCDEWEILDAEGNDLPDWLTIEVEDEIDEEEMEWDGIVKMNATAAPLPEGTTYRECDVLVHYPGAYLRFVAQQGTKPAGIAGDVNNDGSVDIKDLNIVINIVLGQDDASKYDGRADVNKDSKVDIVDVNAIINTILG